MRELNSFVIVRGAEYNTAQSFVALSHLRSIYWSALSAADPGKFSWVYNIPETFVTTTPFLPAVQFKLWPALHFTTASRQAVDYFWFSSQSMKPNWDDEAQQQT